MAAKGEDTAASPAATIVVGFDDSECSFYALEWTLRHFFPGSGGSGTSSSPPFKLVIVHAKPSPASVFGLAAGLGTADVLPSVESNMKKIAETVIQKAKAMCIANSVVFLML